MKTILITDGTTTFTQLITDEQADAIQIFLQRVAFAPTIRPPGINLLADSYAGEDGLTRHIATVPAFEPEPGADYEMIMNAAGEPSVNLGTPPWGTSFDYRRILGGFEIKIRAFNSAGELWSEM